jgi:hypothetical protein
MNTSTDLDCKIKILLDDPELHVTINHNDEISYELYSIEVIKSSDSESNEFWIESFATKKKALEYITTHKLKYDGKCHDTRTLNREYR